MEREEKKAMVFSRGWMMEKGYNFSFFFCEVMQVEVVFCVVLGFRWQSSLIIEHLSPFDLQFARAHSPSVPSTRHAAAVNLQ